MRLEAVEAIEAIEDAAAEATEAICYVTAMFEIMKIFFSSESGHVYKKVMLPGDRNEAMRAQPPVGLASRSLSNSYLQSVSPLNISRKMPEILFFKILSL